MRKKTEADHILDDALDLARTEIQIEARRWVRRAKAEAVEKIIRKHQLSLQTTGPKPLSKKQVKIIDAS